MKIKILLVISILFFCNNIFAQPDLIFKSSFSFVSRLNDSGITWAGDYPSGNSLTCTSNITSPQDCNIGRDITDNDDIDGHAGFSFLKLDLNGDSLPVSASSWSCVKDNVTGLVWEVKTNDGGIHDKDNTYRWGGLTSQGSNYGIYYNDWDTLVNTSNNDNLCGFNDWRLPITNELESLLDLSGVNPAIDSGYFPNTVSMPYWLASPLASTSSAAWAIDFDSNIGFSTISRSAFRYVRLVRF